MFKFINKKITSSISLFLGQVFLATKVFALEYQPLVPDAFGAANKLTKATTLTEFLTEAFNLGLAICAALAVVMIVWGGVEYMLSESVFSKDEGRKKIRNAILGLLLAVFSWLILYIINPSILNWERFDVKNTANPTIPNDIPGPNDIPTAEEELNIPMDSATEEMLQARETLINNTQYNMRLAEFERINGGPETEQQKRIRCSVISQADKTFPTPCN